MIPNLGKEDTVVDYIESKWNGFRRFDFRFEDRKAILVFPDQAAEGNKWLLKTEYFDAFPSFELDMVKRGYYLAYLSNKTRWYTPEDADSKARFCEFLRREYAFHEKCIPVGFSCGGMHAVYFAAKYPQYVAALYLDAPVLNLLSCPCGVGASNGYLDDMYEEFVNATGMTRSELINYRNHPIDHVGELIKANIPTFLVCGDSDTIVPYAENGKVLSKMFVRQGGNLTEILKKGCDHHPHGLEDNTPLIEFVLKYY